MESELSGIFRVKLVTKNIVRGSLGTQFMHMRVNNAFFVLYVFTKNPSRQRTQKSNLKTSLPPTTLKSA